jgi:hypothetical protein
LSSKQDKSSFLFSLSYRPYGAFSFITWISILKKAYLIWKKIIITGTQCQIAVEDMMFMQKHITYRMCINSMPRLFARKYFFKKINSEKINNISMFGNVMEKSWKTSSSVWLCHEK